MTHTTTSSAIEWPTLLICALCYGGFILSTAFADDLGLLLSAVILTVTLTLYSSFSHEVLHGHPFRNEAANTALVFPALGLLVPYHRFRDTHLAHHHDPSLTDPYDDPESNYIDPAVWVRWSRLRQGIYNWNNTLLGRMMIGPVIGLGTFYCADARALRTGDRRIVAAYLFHLAGLVPVILWLVWISDIPFWLYAVAVYGSHSILKIRTFLEHRAHDKARCRTVIIEDRGLLSYLFLKNNLHAVHHASPNLPWYALPDAYAARRDAILVRNGGYAFRSYLEIARLFLFTAKDPVPHLLRQTPKVGGRFRA
ncbi:fatty acid desaturase [Roseobacter weihaiensis]|uniref:fatty acid desaturase n=1 Tax=Roseobacter weihaiensis TaxID=2763262 RepID=UPI001D09B1AD|nr:fatty acid desaturase [Roseobacter sp. H9]